jgi:hypothetical protein
MISTEFEDSPDRKEQETIRLQSDKLHHYIQDAASEIIPHGPWVDVTQRVLEAIKHSTILLLEKVPWDEKPLYAARVSHPVECQDGATARDSALPEDGPFKIKPSVLELSAIKRQDMRPLSLEANHEAILPVDSSVSAMEYPRSGSQLHRKNDRQSRRRSSRDSKALDSEDSTPLFQATRSPIRSSTGLRRIV